jgi:hypothetical protein
VLTLGTWESMWLTAGILGLHQVYIYLNPTQVFEVNSLYSILLQALPVVWLKYYSGSS